MALALFLFCGLGPEVRDDICHINMRQYPIERRHLTLAMSDNLLRLLGGQQRLFAENLIEIGWTKGSGVTRFLVVAEDASLVKDGFAMLDGSG